MNDTAWLNRIPVKIAICFAAVSLVWISCSDAVLSSIVHNQNLRLRLDLYLGFSYVIVMSGLLYLLLRRYVSIVRRHEQDYQILADSGQALVWLAGTDKLCNYFNKTWLEFTGRTIDQEKGDGWAEGVHPDDLQRCLDIYTGSFERREKFSMDYRLKRHDGEYRWLQDDGSPRYDSNGEFLGYIGFCLDVTEAKQLEIELARSNEFMSAILDCLSDGVVVCDKEGRLSLFNRSTRDFHQLPELPLPPEQWAAYYSLYEPDGVTPLKMEKNPLFRALQGESVNDQEIVIAPVNSRPLTLLATGRQLLSGTGENLGAVISLHDVTKEKALEEQLRHSQKMESIGALAGGVAHDFNNILTVIIGASSLLEMEMVDRPEMLKLVAQISSSAERAAKLTQSLLTFSRRQEIRKQPEDVCKVVNTMHDFIGRIIGEDILLTTYLPDNPVSVMIDRGQIEQVLMNLAANARDAMQHSGSLNISVALVENNGSLLDLEECPPGFYAMISVADSGEGMDKDKLLRIFEPFFTTKVLGKGTGLGLSIAYGIIKKHDGVIRVCSEPGKGTEFRIYLPSIDAQEKHIATLVPKRSPEGSETILLVEDDQTVLAVNKGLLEKAGYFVLTAADGEEAMELFKRTSGTIALVILDVILPGRNGLQIQSLMQTIRPDIPILFVSGYKADMLNRKGLRGVGSSFLPKPLDPHVLLGRVRKLIDADRGNYTVPQAASSW